MFISKCVLAASLAGFFFSLLFNINSFDCFTDTSRTCVCLPQTEVRCSIVSSQMIKLRYKQLLSWNF